MLGTVYLFTGMTQNEAEAEFADRVLPVLRDYGIEHDHNLVLGLPAGPSDINLDGQCVARNVRTLTLPRWELLEYAGDTELLIANLHSELGYLVSTVDANVVVAVGGDIQLFEPPDD